jgi:exodeoxyribonuclease-3
MRIVTWNVNGLRAVLAKGGFTWIQALKPDVICLQEIKARPEQLYGLIETAFDSFHASWHPAEKPGYSGVATLVWNEPVEFQIGLQVPRYDAEGRVIISRHPGFLLFNVYFPNGARDLSRLTYKLDFYADLLDLVDQLHAKGEKVVICGDFNTAHREIDLRNPKPNATTSGFLPEERAWIDKYLQHDLVDAYRVLYPERVQYTWWTYRLGARERNVGWRLDYYLISSQLVQQVEDVVIHTELTGSDHCPVSLIIQPS